MARRVRVWGWAAVAASAVFWFAGVAQAEAPAKSAPTDHQKVAGHFGLGFLGVSDLPLPVAAPGGTSQRPSLTPNDKVVLTHVSAPVLGLRYWWSQCVGFEAGLGFFYSAGSVSAELGDASSEVEKQTIFAALIHAGVPLRLADTQHMVLLLTPELTFGTARSDVSPLFEDNAPPAAELRGYRLDLGARAGGEIHFGFMNLPNLALEASVGVFLSSEWASATVANQSLTDVSTALSTSSLNAPWDIFSGLGNVAARYYF